MRVELFYKLDRLDDSVLHLNIVDHNCNTILSIPTNIEYSTKLRSIVDYIDKYIVYKNVNMYFSDFIEQVLEENLLLDFSKCDVINLDNLQPGYIDKYKLPFYYDSDKEQVVDEHQFKIWLKLQRDNLLIISDRLAYYIG